MKLFILSFLFSILMGSTKPTTMAFVVMPTTSVAFRRSCSHNTSSASASAANNRKNTRLSVLGDDHFDMEELKRRISQEKSATAPQVFAAPSSSSSLVQHKKQQKNNDDNNNKLPPEQVSVVLFYPHTQDEGMHTIEYPKGSGNNVILAFEDMADCHKFAQLLKAQQFHEDPTPQTMDLSTLESYCQVLGVFVQVVPKGTNLIPPSQNVPNFGHDPNLMSNKERLGYLFEMSDVEVEHDPGVIVEEQEYAGSWE